LAIDPPPNGFFIIFVSIYFPSEAIHKTVFAHQSVVDALVYGVFADEIDNVYILRLANTMNSVF